MPSRITVAVCVPMTGVGGTGRPLPGGNGVPCDLWYSCLRRSIHLGGAAIVVILDWHNGLYIWYIIARGFDPWGGFPLVRYFAIGYNVFMPMSRFVTVL